MCFCGDFRQTLLIVIKGTRGQIVGASIKRSPLWRHIRTLRLTVNMRLLCPDLPPNQQEEQRAFSERILAVGDGQGMDPDSDKIHWPIRSIVPDNSIEALTNTVFPGISDQNGPLPTTAYLADRVLLAARNDTVTGINHSILNTMPGECLRSRGKALASSRFDIRITTFIALARLQEIGRQVFTGLPKRCASVSEHRARRPHRSSPAEQAHSQRR